MHCSIAFKGIIPSKSVALTRFSTHRLIQPEPTSNSYAN